MLIKKYKRMRKCAYCKHIIETDDIQCPYCEENLIAEEAQRWNFSKRFICASYLFLGPFSLPLIFSNPRFDKRTKYLSAIVLIFLWLAVLTSLIFMGRFLLSHDLFKITK